MIKNYAEEQRDAFNLLLRYKSFENLILLNYPFGKDWILSYMRRNHHLELSHYMSYLNRNENLQVDWKEMYNSRTEFLVYSAICSNKIACNALIEAGISIKFRTWEWEEKLPETMKINNAFGINELSEFLETGMGNEGVFESKEIWEQCFKDYVDEQMIDAWTYHDTLDKEIIIQYQLKADNFENQMQQRLDESNEIAIGEYDKDNIYNEDNVINQAFEGDSENTWNVD